MGRELLQLIQLLFFNINKFFISNKFRNFSIGVKNSKYHTFLISSFFILFILTISAEKDIS